MTYLARLHALKAQTCPSEALTKPTKPPCEGRSRGFVSFGSDPHRHFSKSSVADPGRWCATLQALDPNRPPAGMAGDWWRALVADARWLAGKHAEAAASLGWTASDLFGVRPQFGPGEGGVADRLDGARRLAFTGNVAHWQSPEGEGWLWRRTLDPKPLLWEV